MIAFRGRTALDAWNLAANELRSGDHIRRSDSRLGPTREIPQAAFVIEDPRQRWIGSRRPPANIALALAEVIWIMSARSDSSFLRKWSKTYGKYVSMQPTLHDAYGARLRKHFGIDQLKQAAHALSANSSTRQVALQIWDATADLPFENGSPRDPNIPCNVLAMLKIHDQRLEWTQVLRSNDFFRGTPFNFFQFTTLQELVAGWIGVEPGCYTHFADSLHLYEADAAHIAEQSPRGTEIDNLDSLRFGMEDSFRYFRLLEKETEEITRASSEQDLLRLAVPEIPQPLLNFRTILICERLRQLGNYNAARDFLRLCRNPALASAFTAWADYLFAQKATLAT